MINNIEKLLKILYNYRSFFETLFEKRNQTISIQEVVSDSIDLEKLQYFSEIELITLDDDFVTLDDRIVDFFEEFLDTSRDTKIGVVDDILEHLRFHIANLKGAQTHQTNGHDIKKIKRYLKQIPNILLKNFIQLSHHIGLEYKTSQAFQTKLAALNFHRSRVQKLQTLKQRVEKTLQIEQNFFKANYDTEILSLQQQLYQKLDELSTSLITLQKQVVEYINRTMQKASFWQKVIKIKELKDSYELKEKTDLVKLLHPPMPLGFSSKQKVFKTNLSRDLIFEPSYKEIVLKLLHHKTMQKPKPKIAAPFDQELLNTDQTRRFIIDTDRLHSEFCATSYSLFDFILSKNFEQKLDFIQKIELFCKMLLLYENDYELIENKKIFSGFRYIDVYAKK